MKKLVALLFLTLVFTSCKSTIDKPKQAGQPNELEMREARTQFLQKHFSKFVPVQFQKGTNSGAAIQYLRVQRNMFDYQGLHCCGIRFKIPDWLDGNFECLYWLAKTAANQDFISQSFQWDFIPKTGRPKGLNHYVNRRLEEYPTLKDRFPYTKGAMVMFYFQEQLIPGQEYAIWWGIKEKNVPDIAFTIAINSKRGEKETGLIPVR